MKKSILIITVLLIISLGYDAHGEVSHVSASYNSVSNEKPIKPFQLSILPVVGTDGTDAVNYRYRVSLNLFAGLTGGVEGIELGYFININLGNVKGFQLSGFGNIVNGSAEGFQAAGFGNILNGNSSGFQAAGFMNIIHGQAEGVRGAGFMNVISGNKEGLLAAGFMNTIGGDTKGLSAAGFGNFYRRSFTGISAAGFMNTFGGQADGIHIAGFGNAYNRVSRGIMLAGFGNFAKERVQGTQLAGFMNTSGDLQGLQVAGFLNVARKVDGIQLGFINVSDTISGVPIGFLSISRKGGLRQFELAASDAMITSVSFKIGVHQFYNVFSIGYLPLHKEVSWATGYGIGTNVDIADDKFMQLELHSYQLHENSDWWSPDFDFHLNEFRVLFSKRQNQGFEFFGGPVFYWQRIRKNKDLNINDLSLAPYSFIEHNSNHYNSKWWAGARAGIRFVWR